MDWRRIPLRRNVDASTWTLGLKVLLLAVFIAASNDGAWQRLQGLAAPSQAAAFLALWGLSAAALFCVAFSPHRSSRYFWTGVFALCSLVAQSYSLITGSYLRLADAEQLLGLLAFADNVLDAYAGPLLLGALIGVIGIVALNMPPFWPARGRPSRKWLAAAMLLPCVPVAATAGVLYLRGGHGTDGLPVQFTSQAFALVLGLEKLLAGPEPERKPVAIAAANKARARTVIVIMDESVRGDLLDINRPGGAYSGLLAHGAAMANFGVMSSIATCSTASNAGFRYGISRHSHLDDLRRNPSIWRYAKKAGYRTVYVDGQRHGGGLMNLMSVEELADIDQHIQLPSDTRPVDRDIQIACKLRSMVERGAQPTFVYVNKMGAHFPYEGKYPRERAPFQPALRRTYFGNEIDPKDVAWPHNEDPDTRIRTRNSYLNAVAWNVGGFFDTLLPGLDLSDAVLVYMADHGQYLNEDGKPGFRSHCSTGEAPAAEGMVPLVVLTGIAPIRESMARAAQKNRDRASQFNVFPSVLALLGYRPEDIARSATRELPLEADLPPGQQQFLSRFFVRLGRGPIWNSIGRDLSLAADQQHGH
ncbi:MAG TPA: sulfatase-like hydrolase/transferase [Burkholderiales bacterium]|nr:sulfatase-like hydrolase/transferase [Burkholderiales bacterium]